ncbi:MAG: dTMP kinase [Synergistaceae bacterium]
MFITIEGIDGSGKSTQAKMLKEWIEKRTDTEVVLTREPGGWEHGTLLRELVLNGKLSHPWSEAYLFMLDRAEHVATVIEPALIENKIVLCERYHDSTLAYQVWGRGLDKESLINMYKISNFPDPDLKILFDVDASIAINRFRKRGKIDSIESEGYEFLSRIRNGYLSLADSEPKKWIKINTDNKKIDDIFAETIDEILSREIF